MPRLSSENEDSPVLLCVRKETLQLIAIDDQLAFIARNQILSLEQTQIFGNSGPQLGATAPRKRSAPRMTCGRLIAREHSENNHGRSSAG